MENEKSSTSLYVGARVLYKGVDSNTRSNYNGKLGTVEHLFTGERTAQVRWDEYPEFKPTHYTKNLQLLTIDVGDLEDDY